MANENDFARDAILRELYDQHKSARGPRGVLVGVKQLQKKLKLKGLKQQEVSSNLDYLIQKGWANEQEIVNRYKSPRGLIQESVSYKYKISDTGIDQLEEASVYNKTDHFKNINITNVGGVTIVGNGNVVNTKWGKFSNYLNELEKSLTTSNNLSEEDKLNFIAEISTIQSQLSKPNPDTSIISRAWNSVEAIASAAGFIEAVEKGSEIIKNLL